MHQWRWFFVLRQKSSIHVWRGDARGWQDFGRFAPTPGWSTWLGQSYLNESEIFSTNLLAYWKIGEKEPWCLATNLPDEKMTRDYYFRRMWIKEMFGDLKRHGFDLELTMLRHFLRLSRLTLAVALLFLWMLATGTRAIRNGLRHVVDRKDRRDLSVFQIGLRVIERRLTNELSIRLPLCI